MLSLVSVLLFEKCVFIQDYFVPVALITNLQLTDGMLIVRIIIFSFHVAAFCRHPSLSAVAPSLKAWNCELRNRCQNIFIPCFNVFCWSIVQNLVKQLRWKLSITGWLVVNIVGYGSDICVWFERLWSLYSLHDAVGLGIRNTRPYGLKAGPVSYTHLTLPTILRV